MNLRTLNATDAARVAALDAALRGPSAWSMSQWIPYLVPTCAIAAFEGENLLAFAVFQPLVDEAELLFIGVDQAHQQQGIAHELLHTAVRDLAHAGYRKIHLEVRANNHAAQSLYRSFDFVQIGRRSAYYRDGEDAILMQRAL